MLVYVLSLSIYWYLILHIAEFNVDPIQRTYQRNAAPSIAPSTTLCMNFKSFAFDHRIASFQP